MGLDKTIITFEDLKSVRAISSNIPDKDRVLPYIREAEFLTVSDEITPRVYVWLVNSDRDSDNTYVDGNGNSVNVTKDQLDLLLNGGVFDGDGCRCDNGEMINGGLIPAISYLAYSRLIKSNMINVTAFGVTVKKSTMSEPADEKTIFRASGENFQIGLSYLNQAKEYLKTLGLIEGFRRSSQVNVKIKKISKYGYKIPRRY